MKRREAIKGLGMSLGLVVATPTVISLLQSCKSDPKIDWTPNFLSPEEGLTIKKIVGLILPGTDALPSATEVNIPEFIDKYLSVLAGNEEKKSYKTGIAAITNALGGSPQKTSDDDYTNLLTKYLSADQEEKEAFKQKEEDNLILQTLYKIRDKAIWGYRNSQKVGMEILAYDPIPGVYNGCIPLEEATGGKAWSLK